MTNNPKSQDDIDESEQLELNHLLLTGLSPVFPNPDLKNGLTKQLSQRISQSLLEQAGLKTIRLKQGVWQKLGSGIRYKPLWKGPEGHSVLIEFAPGASLPPHRHHSMEEGIVLRGDLAMGKLVLGPLDYHRTPEGSRHASITSRNGALAYLRGTSLGDNHSVLGELLGGLLPFAGDRHVTVYNQNWADFQEIITGVWGKDLYSDSHKTSRMYRFAAGAKMSGCSHQLDTECMVLAGEIFLGDRLLQVGDYQLAAAGSHHAEFYSDVGAVLFMRGLIR